MTSLINDFLLFIENLFVHLTKKCKKKCSLERYFGWKLLVARKELSHGFSLAWRNMQTFGLTWSSAISILCSIIEIVSKSNVQRVKLQRSIELINFRLDSVDLFFRGRHFKWMVSACVLISSWERKSLHRESWKWFSQNKMKGCRNRNRNRINVIWKL